MTFRINNKRDEGQLSPRRAWWKGFFEIYSSSLNTGNHNRTFVWISDLNKHKLFSLDWSVLQEHLSFSTCWCHVTCETLKAVFKHISKHLVARQKYFAMCRTCVFISLLGVWKCGQPWSFVLDILNMTSQGRKTEVILKQWLIFSSESSQVISTNLSSLVFRMFWEEWILLPRTWLVIRPIDNCWMQHNINIIGSGGPFPWL